MKFRILMLLMCASISVQAADCSNQGIQASTDDAANFDYANDGSTVTDKTTGLMWMRCSIGQFWNKNTFSCDGQGLKGEWDKMVLIKDFNDAGGYANKQDWRLPNINELRSIVEDCRSDPAINGILFPNTPATKYWTASPYIGLPTNAWVVDFGQGRDNFELKTTPNAVRLVRFAD